MLNSPCHNLQHSNCTSSYAVKPSEVNGPHRQWVHNHGTEVTNTCEKGGIKATTPLIHQDTRHNNTCTKNNTLTTKQIGIASHTCDRRPGIAVTRWHGIVDRTARIPKCKITRTGSGQTVHMPVRLGIDT